MANKATAIQKAKLKPIPDTALRQSCPLHDVTSAGACGATVCNGEGAGQAMHALGAAGGGSSSK